MALEGTASKTVSLLFQYVLNMARYDLDYGVRDRARFLRALVYGKQKVVSVTVDQDSDENDHENGQQESDSTEQDAHNDDEGFEYSEKELNLSDHIKAILLSEKAAPIQENPSHGKTHDRELTCLHTMPTHLSDYIIHILTRSRAIQGRIDVIGVEPGCGWIRGITRLAQGAARPVGASIGSDDGGAWIHE